MNVDPEAGDGAYEALLQFLYMAPIGLVQLARDGAVEMMNPMSARLLLPLAPAGGLANLFDVLGGVAPDLRQKVDALAGASGSVVEGLRMEARSTHAAAPGGEHVLSLSLLKLDESRLMAVLRDVTHEVVRERRQLNAASRLDSLTAMPNRAAVRDYIQFGLDRAAAPSQRTCAVLFINVDRFKQINDALGHSAGDEALALLGNRLRAALRQGVRTRGDDAREPIAARLGGDEFAVVLDDLAQGDDVHIVARRIADFLAQPFGIRHHQWQFGFSMGVVLRAQFAGDADAVLQDASIAMVEAKRLGGDRYVVFRPEMRSRAAQLREMESDLRGALAHGQLFVVYQPVVGFVLDADGTRRIDRAVGVEALVRWRHPRRGNVAPMEFIGIAEECGLIGALGDFVLESACRQFMAWRETLGEHAPRSLAVNLSRGQLAIAGFVDAVARVLRETQMPARDLQLEITESLAAQDEAVQMRLHELKALGLTLALDDFGTGYSSLSSLHLLPVTTVKIDRSFVSESVTSAHHRVLIEATVRVAESLSMSTVAEGIETAEQSALIAALGCTKGQGYFFSRPLEPDDLARWASQQGVA